MAPHPENVSALTAVNVGRGHQVETGRADKPGLHAVCLVPDTQQVIAVSQFFLAELQVRGGIVFARLRVLAQQRI